MTVKFGFYDSLNGDRLYNANDFNTIFEGVFSDGVFEHVGDALHVEPNPGVMGVLVRDGRAWFNNSWIRNTSTLALAMTPSDLIYDRKDLIILEFDSSITVRENSIKVLTGVPSATPISPVLVNSGTVHQYALAEIHVPHGSTEVDLLEITNRIGTLGTPYATSLISEPSPAPITTALNDFQLGDGFGNWIKKTLSQTVTILLTILDTIYAPLSTVSAKQMLMGSALNSNVPAASTYYILVGSVNPINALGYNMEITAPCIISSLRMASTSLQPVSGSLEIYVLKNNIRTSITATLAAGSGNIVITDTIHSESFNVGDLIILELKNNATAVSSTISRHSLLARFT